VGADALLQELEAALVLGDLEQLHGSALVRGESGKKQTNGSECFV
jgi:hypothetical protein